MAMQNRSSRSEFCN